MLIEVCKPLSPAGSSNSPHPRIETLAIRLKETNPDLIRATQIVLLEREGLNNRNSNPDLQAITCLKEGKRENSSEDLPTSAK
jgi:hypothetical protein